MPVSWLQRDRAFRDLVEFWLDHDPVKLRFMRTHGAPWELLHETAEPQERFTWFARHFREFAETPEGSTAAAELSGLFGIRDRLTEETAPDILAAADDLLQNDPDRSIRGIAASLGVQRILLEADPIDAEAPFRALAASERRFQVVPLVRFDSALRVDDPDFFNDYAYRLGEAGSSRTTAFAGFLEAIRVRHHAFMLSGADVSILYLRFCPDRFASEEAAGIIYDRARNGRAALPEDAEAYAGFMLQYFAALCLERDWSLRLELGGFPARQFEVPTRFGGKRRELAVSDEPQAPRLALLLDQLALHSKLPRMEIRTLHPPATAACQSVIDFFQAECEPPGGLHLTASREGPE